MKRQAAPDAAIGWFGKIPSLGDFAGRGLPASFVSVWDRWLSAELMQARAVWADAWASTYRAAPQLCFTLGSGVVDEHAWHGLLMPSVDRVEREFPLTFAQRRAPQSAAPLQPDWWNALAHAGWEAQRPSCGLDGVTAALRTVAALATGHEAPPSEALPDGMPSDGGSAWWVLHAPDARVLSAGLPQGTHFRRLLGGL